LRFVCPVHQNSAQLHSRIFAFHALRSLRSKDLTAAD
jgi:hypothetical protein